MTLQRHRTHVALVTAELRNELVVVSLPGGPVVRRIPVASDPKTVAAAPGAPVAVVSPGSGTVTMFSARLRRLAVFRHFRSPQLASFTPDGEYLLVTDAAAGTLTSMELARMRVVGRVAVGTGAHHLAVSPTVSRPGWRWASRRTRSWWWTWPIHDTCVCCGGCTQPPRRTTSPSIRTGNDRWGSDREAVHRRSRGAPGC